MRSKEEFFDKLLTVVKQIISKLQSLPGIHMKFTLPNSVSQNPDARITLKGPEYEDHLIEAEIVLFYLVASDNEYEIHMDLEVLDIYKAEMLLVVHQNITIDDLPQYVDRTLAIFAKHPRFIEE